MPNPAPSQRAPRPPRNGSSRVQAGGGGGARALRATTGSTRERILAAAVKVAAEKGISGASVDEIALVAAVAKGSVYYNYASKDAIFAELLQNGFESVNQAVIDATATGEGHDLIYAAALAILRFLQENLDLAKVMAAEMFRVDRPWEEALTVTRATVSKTLAGAIERSRTCPAPPATDTAGAAFFGAVLAAGLNWLVFHPDEPVAAIVSQLADLIGLQPTQHPLTDLLG